MKSLIKKVFESKKGKILKLMLVLNAIVAVYVLIATRIIPLTPLNTTLHSILNTVGFIYLLPCILIIAPVGFVLHTTSAPWGKQVIMFFNESVWGAVILYSIVLVVAPLFWTGIGYLLKRGVSMLK